MKPARETYTHKTHNDVKTQVSKYRMQCHTSKTQKDVTCVHEEDSLVCSTYHTHLSKHTTAHIHNHCALTGAGHSENASDQAARESTQKICTRRAGCEAGIRGTQSKEAKSMWAWVGVNPLKKQHLGRGKHGMYRARTAMKGHSDAEKRRGSCWCGKNTCGETPAAKIAGVSVVTIQDRLWEKKYGELPLWGYE